MKIHAFRLKPQDDVYNEIEKYVTAHSIKAGVILSAVGNIYTAVLRLSNENIIKKYKNMKWGFEIVSVTGTVSTSRNHLHISFSDDTAKTFGGHLQPGCIVRITAEIIIGEIPHMVFKRKYDKRSGFKELFVEKVDK